MFTVYLDSAVIEIELIVKTSCLSLKLSLRARVSHVLGG